MDQLSDKALGLISLVANGALIVGAILALAGTAGSVLSTHESERRADLRLSQNERETAEANSAAATARLEAIRLAERAASLEERAATANLELERLKKNVSWRAIEDGQFGDAVAALTAETQPYEISTAGDGESRSLMYRIVELLDSAGWRRSPPSGDPITADGVANIVDHTGIDLVTSTKDGRSRDRAERLAAQLDLSGLPARLVRHSELDEKPETILVVVGRRTRPST